MGDRMIVGRRWYVQHGGYVETDGAAGREEVVSPEGLRAVIAALADELEEVRSALAGEWDGAHGEGRMWLVIADLRRELARAREEVSRCHE